MFCQLSKRDNLKEKFLISWGVGELFPNKISPGDVPLLSILYNDLDFNYFRQKDRLEAERCSMDRPSISTIFNKISIYLWVG